MAEENKPKIQKILIPPPRGGLNLHDNPLELNPVYATELTNFMPPTSVLEVRPAVERILEIKGQVRGMYSYTMGAIQITRPELEEPFDGWDLFSLDKIIIKLLTHDGSTRIFELNPRTNMVSPIRYDFDTKRAPSFNVDSAVFMNSLFFLDGGNEQIPYVYNEKQGLNKMAWKIVKNPGQEVPDYTYAENIDNLTMYKGFLYANEIGTLNICYMNAQTADIEDIDKNWSNETFTPQVTDMFNLNGVLQHGGEIFRIDTISNATNNSVTNYLVVISTNGEMLVYDGPSPADIANWKLVGNFRIPIPLNKFCFCKMEGDIVAATSNGLVSLRRIIFGQQSKITEALEWRLSSLFNEYSFTNITLRDFFFLQYYQSDRLLVFNVPLQVPCRLDEVKEGYKLSKGMNLMLNSVALNGNDNADAKNKFYASAVSFIFDYIVKRGSDYWVKLWFNYSTDKYIDLHFENVDRASVNTYINVTFRLHNGDKEINLFKSDSINFISEFTEGMYQMPYLDKSTSEFEWNGQFLVPEETTLINLNTTTGKVYKLPIDNDYVVTNIDITETPSTVITSAESVLDDLEPGQEPPKDISGELIYMISYNSYSRIYDRHFAEFVDGYTKAAYDNTKDYRPVKDGGDEVFSHRIFRIYNDIMDTGFYHLGQYNGRPDIDTWNTGVSAERKSFLGLTSADNSGHNSFLRFSISARCKIIDIGRPLDGLVLINTTTNQTFSGSSDSVYSTDFRNLNLAIINTIDLQCTYGGTLFNEDFKLISGGFSTRLSFVSYIGGSSFLLNHHPLYPTTKDSYYDKITFNGPRQRIDDYEDQFDAPKLIEYTTPAGVKILAIKNQYGLLPGRVPLASEEEINVLNGVKQEPKFTYNNMSNGQGQIPSLISKQKWSIEQVSVTPIVTISFGRIDTDGVGGESPLKPPTEMVYDQTDNFTKTFRDTNKSFDKSITKEQYNDAINNSELYMIGNLYIPGGTELLSRSDSSNVDLSIVPFINQVNIDCAYKSEQYVMNSHYGTWSKWEDINMVMAISHMDKFYFICLTDESISDDLDIKKCFLCTFNKEFNGDLNSIPIKARYKSGHSDFNVPNQKLFKKVKVYGSNPTFWGEEENKVPYRFIFETDFKANEPIDYPYTSRAIQPHDVGILKLSRKTLDQMELKLYNLEYAKVGKQIRFIELPITSNPATRISIGSEFSISEHNIVVYGYELYYVVVLP
jgi:hypothetical protein